MGISQFLLQETMDTKNSPCFFAVVLFSLSIAFRPWASAGPTLTSVKLFDPDVLKQCLEAALIPFMQLVLKLFNGLIIFLHLTHWSVPSPFG